MKTTIELWQAATLVAQTYVTIQNYVDTLGTCETNAAWFAFDNKPDSRAEQLKQREETQRVLACLTARLDQQLPHVEPNDRLLHAWRITALVHGLGRKTFDTHAAYLLGKHDAEHMIAELRALLPETSAPNEAFSIGVAPDMLLPTRKIP